MDRATHGGQRGLGFEHVHLVLSDTEPDGAHALVTVYEGVGDEDALEVLPIGLRQSVLGSLGNDDLVRLAVDHQLPTTLVDVSALLILPDGQAPLLEQVNRRVHVASDAGHEVLAGDAHEVVPDVVTVILQGIVAAVQVHVLVDGR